MKVLNDVELVYFVGDVDKLEECGITPERTSLDGNQGIVKQGMA